MSVFIDVYDAVATRLQKSNRINKRLERIDNSITDVKLDIDSLENKLRKIKLFVVYCYILIPIAFLYMVLSWAIGWFSVIGCTVLVAIFSNGLRSSLIWFCKLPLKSKISRLKQLKERKRTILENMKNTESFTVAIDMLQKVNTSTDEKPASATKIQYPIVHLLISHLQKQKLYVS